MINRIKHLRELAKMKQSELAELLNVSQSTLSNWERGIYEPDNATLIELSRKFNVSTDYLLGRNADSGAVYNANNIISSSNNFFQGTGNVVNEGAGNVITGGGNEDMLSVEETELVRIYRMLNAKKRHVLMSHAFGLEKSMVNSEQLLEKKATTNEPLIDATCAMFTDEKV